MPIAKTKIGQISYGSMIQSRIKYWKFPKVKISCLLNRTQNCIYTQRMLSVHPDRYKQLTNMINGLTPQ